MSKRDSIGKKLIDEVSFSIGDQVISKHVYIPEMDKFIEVGSLWIDEEIEEYKMLYKKFHISEEDKRRWESTMEK